MIDPSTLSTMIYANLCLLVDTDSIQPLNTKQFFRSPPKTLKFNKSSLLID
jgi:hypothetical protein